MLNCSFIAEGIVECDGTQYHLPEEKLTYEDKEFWIYFAIYVALVLAAGMMSGLTMGLLSLDLLTLKVLKDGGSPAEKKHASRIFPLVRRHHLLLVTLLLGNAAAVEAMPIFLDRISSPVIAILVSVTAVLIFGEVIPQAICTRFGLAIGSIFAPLVYFFMGLFFIVAWPLSKLLDLLLGKDHSTFYRRTQLKVLVDLHATPDSHQNQEALTQDEALIIKGALDMKSKTVKDAMVPLECVYMIDINRSMDHDTMTELLTHTHSRVPIYDGDQQNIVALLLLKTLIHLDPEDATPIRDIVTRGEAKPVIYVSDDMPLFDILNNFQEGKGHLAIVKHYEGHEVQVENQSAAMEDDPEAPLLRSRIGYDDDDSLIDIRPKVIGVITLEDVIEELIQEEIIDETDVYVDIKRHIQVARAKAAKISPLPQRTRNLRRSVSVPETQSHHRNARVIAVNSTDVPDDDDVQLLNNEVLA